MAVFGMKTARSTRLELMKIVEQQTTIVDRLAICRLEDTGYRSNGYLITAYAGENADACCIIHGYSDGEIGDKMRPPLSASFYANSFSSRGTKSLRPFQIGNKIRCSWRRSR